MSSRFSRKKGPQGLPPVCRKPPEPLCDMEDVPEFLQSSVYVDDGTGDENFIHINETVQVTRDPGDPTLYTATINRPAWILTFIFGWDAATRRVRAFIRIIFDGGFEVICNQPWLAYPGVEPFDTLAIDVPVITLAARASVRVAL